MSGFFERERFQRARKFHLCAQNHLIRPGETYCVGINLPGSGSYRVGLDDWETIDWDWGWSKLCMYCYDSRQMMEDDPTRRPPPRYVFDSLDLRRAFEEGLRDGREPEPPCRVVWRSSDLPLNALEGDWWVPSKRAAYDAVGGIS